LAAFDLETTGTDPKSDRIVTAAISFVGDGLPGEHHAWLVNPGVEIPAGATAVHGITSEKACSEGNDAEEAAERITSLLAEQMLDDVPVVAFNARFDFTVLDREARRRGITPLVDRVGGPPGMLVIDPLVLDRHSDRFRKGKRTLQAVCHQYRVPFNEAHVANADAIAAARVAYRMGTILPELRGMNLRELHNKQIAWAERQAASLEQYFRERGNSERVERAWPIIPVTATLGEELAA
jgi:DNA polymerase-3 subunit epsilon